MIRQSTQYRRAGLAGVALISAAILIFIVIASSLVLQDWPLSAVGLGNEIRTDEKAGQGQPTGPEAALGGPTGPGATGAGSATGGAGGAARQRKEGKRPEGPGAGRRRGVPVAPGSEADPPAVEPVLTGSPPPTQAGASPPSRPQTPPATSRPAPVPPESSRSTTTGALTETAKQTVSTVDTATGGTVGQTGLDKTVGEVVDKAIRPKSALGKTVDKLTGR